MVLILALKIEESFGMISSNPLSQKKIGKKERTFLLTGANGSLGSFTLRDLLCQSSSIVKRIYCLLRGTNPQERLLEAFQQRQLDCSLLTDERLIILSSPMNLSEEYLGQTNEVYEKLKENLTDIIHSAWKMNFNQTIKDLELDSILGVYHLLKLSSYNQIQFHFISSISSASSGLYSIIKEEPLHKQIQIALPQGYGQKIPLDLPKKRVKQTNNDESLSDRLTNIKIIENSSPSTGPITTDQSPVKLAQLFNVLSPTINPVGTNSLSCDQFIEILSSSLDNDSPAIVDNKQSTGDDQKENIALVSDNDKFINDELVDDYDSEDNFMKNLEEENSIVMKKFDNQIGQYETKIKKTVQQLKQINKQLQKMDGDMRKLISEKEQKKNEFIQIINEHKRELKTRKQNQNRKKSIKRMKQTNSVGRKIDMASIN
ncbi:hypothetical protein I4U23_017309 [Adineta vaga]|nr:hypothetical protein I4U23_017309 [Adineta vaga]